MSTADPRLSSERHKNQLWLTIDDAGSKNAIDTALTDALAEEIESATSDIVVLTGKNGAFSTGGHLATLMELAERVTDEPAKVEKIIRHGGSLIEDIVFSRRTTVAVVDGVCAGAGLGIALACDYVLTTSRSRFITAYSKLGLTSDFGTEMLLAARVGDDKAADLMADSPSLNARDALKLGIADLEIDEVSRKAVKKALRAIKSPRRPVPDDFSGRLDEEAAQFVAGLSVPKTRLKIESKIRKMT